jgi:hypothetical protein
MNSVTGVERNAMCDPSKILTDDYWNLLNNTRGKKEGPDGIFIWNTLTKEFLKRKNKENSECIDN